MSPRNPSAEITPLKPPPLSGPTEEEAERLARPVDELVLMFDRRLDAIETGLRSLSEAEGRRHSATERVVDRLRVQIEVMAKQLGTLVESKRRKPR